MAPEGRVMSTICNPMLVITKMPDGGYLVTDGLRNDGFGRIDRFASTSIDESLKYIKSQFEPRERK